MIFLTIICLNFYYLLAMHNHRLLLGTSIHFETELGSWEPASLVVQLSISWNIRTVDHVLKILFISLDSADTIYRKVQSLHFAFLHHVPTSSLFRTYPLELWQFLLSLHLHVVVVLNIRKIVVFHKQFLHFLPGEFGLFCKFIHFRVDKYVLLGNQALADWSHRSFTL